MNKIPNRHILGLRQDNVSESHYESAIIVFTCILLSGMILLFHGCTKMVAV